MLLAALLALAVLASSQQQVQAQQVEPLSVELRSLSADIADIYDWSVTSTLLNSQNLTLSGNATSTAFFQLEVRRKPAGSAHSVAGTIIASNPAENLQSVEVEAFRVALSTGGLFGSTTKTLSCKGGSLGPGEVIMCEFNVPASSGIKSITPSAVLRGAPAATGDGSPVTFSSQAADGETDAAADDSSSSSSSNLGCATVKDSVHAAGAQQGFSMAASTNADGSQLLNGGVIICQEATTLRYTMKIGPFAELEACGAFTFSNKPDVDPAGGGSVVVVPASGTLTVTGCRQKDILGLLKPSASLSQLTVGRETSYVWTASAAAAPAAAASTAASGVASAAAAPVAGLEAAAAREALLLAGSAGGGEAAAGGLLAASTIPFTSTLAVQSVLNLNRSSSSGGPSNSLVGEVTITNTQRVPYILAGGRVAVTPAASSRSSSSRTAQTAASQPTQLFGNLSCPLGAAGSIIVPPQIIDNMPGTLRCTFDLPVNSSVAAGSVQAQLKTLLSSTFEVDSGTPAPFTLSGNTTAMEVGGCVNVWAQRITDAAAVSAADRAANRDLDSILQQVEAQGLRLAGAPASVKGWVPPAPSGLLALPLSVCGNKSIAWTDVHGPFESPRDCGRSLAVMAVTIKPKSGSQQPIHTALAYPLVVTGCGLVPSLALDELRLAAKKSYSWSLDKVATPAGGLALKYNQQDIIKYDVSYNSSSQVSGHRLQALVRLSNPHASPVTVAQVSYALSRPTGQPPLTGKAVCRADAAAATQAALDAARGGGASSLREQPHVLQASPAAVAAAQASAAAAAAASKAGAGNLFGGLFAMPGKPSGNRALLGAASAKQAAAEPAAEPGPEQPAAEWAAAEQAAPEQQQLLDTTGPPLFCSFALPLPDSYASEVTVTTLTDAGEEAAAGPLALDWSQAAMEEVGKCALLSAAFQQTQPASLLQPASVVGTMPPAVKVCEPTQYSFKALFGPFSETQCGEQQAILNVAVALPGSPSATAANDNSISRLTITGCPAALPLVTLAPPVPAEITSSYAWSIERSLQPLEPAGTPAAVSGAGSRMAAPAAVAVEAADGLALFKQTVVFRRGEPVQHGTGGRPRAFQVKGTLSLVNPTDQPLLLSAVEVKITQQQQQPKGAGGAAGNSNSEPVVTAVAAACPKELVRVAADPRQGKVIELPPSGASKPVVCSFGALLGRGGAAEVLAVAVLAADGRRAKSDKAHKVDFTEVKSVTAGSCVKVSESLTLVDAATGQALPPPPSIGAKLPPPTAPETLCATKSFSMLGQVGPLPKAAAGAGARLAAGGGDGAAAVAAQQQAAVGCGALSLISAVVAEPTNGYQGRLLSNGRFDVRFEGCKVQA